MNSKKAKALRKQVLEMSKDTSSLATSYENRRDGSRRHRINAPAGLYRLLKKLSNNAS